MNIIIKCRAVMLARYFKLLVVIGVILSMAIFLFLNINLSYRYLIAMVLVLGGLLISFYLNQNELEMIKIEGIRISFIFINKVFFKKKTCNYQRDELQQKYCEESIDIYRQHQFIAKIRKTALEQEDWIQIGKFLKEV